MELTEKEKMAFAREDLIKAKAKAKKKGTLVSDKKDMFVVRSKLAIWSPKRFRGFYAVAGQIIGTDVLYSLHAGFIKDDKIPFVFPLFNAREIDLVLAAANKKKLTKALRGVNEL